VKSEEQAGKGLLIVIVVALAGWGVLLAVGAYLGMWDSTPQGADSRDPRRFWIVLGAIALFLAFWGTALALRMRRSRPPRRPEGE
jgi:hypothetical protein